MAIRTKHDIQRGINRLLRNPQDVSTRNAAPWQDPPRRLADATPQHRALFEEYEQALQEAVEHVAEWWNARIAVQQKTGLDPDAAMKAAYTRAFAGPASGGAFVWTVRAFWLKCDQLNREVGPDKRVPPQVILLAWLIDDHQDELVQVLTGMPYWPIGLDESGEWV